MLLRYLNDVISCLHEHIQEIYSPGEVRTEPEKLETKVRRIPDASPMGYDSTSGDAETAKITELHRLAILTNISRAYDGLFDEPRDLERSLDRAFALVQGTKTCQTKFPLFIIGGEAKTDEQRVRVLDLMERTRSTTHAEPHIWTR
ncbi:hypothetical protein F5Y16DRAFT_344436 [Xylariaceae sp. FL0255]|nr:hypothetical protein F5Y16DRAFT_344436 [Xylariaceae sp. FL0255]